MKIKHWQGYGSVNAKKIRSTDDFLQIKVFGNHEWGLQNTDTYDVFNWLVKKFDKIHKTYDRISHIDFSYENDEIVNGVPTEVGIYNIYFRK